MSVPKSTVLAGDDVGACVVDCGSWAVRVGHAGEDTPRALHPPVLGLSPPSEGAVQNSNESAVDSPAKNNGNGNAVHSRKIAGDRVLLNPLSLLDIQPVHRYDPDTGAAEVVDWDAMQAVWAAGAANAGVELTAAPLFLVEPTRRWTNGDRDRAAALERAVEGLGVPAVYIGRGAAMAAFASVRTTACVVDVGHQGATAVPVVDGYVLHKTSVVSSVGGHYLSEAMYRAVEDALSRGHPTRTAAAFANGNSGSPATAAVDSRVPIGSRHAKLRAIHEVRRRQKPVLPTTAGVDPDVRSYDITDISGEAPLNNVSDQHRAFYRMYLINDIKASLFRVSPGTNSTQNMKDSVGGGANSVPFSERPQDVLMTNVGDETSAGINGKSDPTHVAAPSGDKEGRDLDREKEREREIEKSKERERPTSGSTTYELPDGNIIDVSQNRIESIANALFMNGADDNSSHRAISNMAFDAISACDIDVRRELYSGIVLTGGCSLISGTIERFTREMAVLTPQLFKMKIMAAQTSVQRTAGPWIGGSIVSSLGTFQQAWVSKEEYEELGSTGALRKCP